MPHEEAVIINNKLDNPDTEVQTSIHIVEDKSKENSNEPKENQLVLCQPCQLLFLFIFVVWFLFLYIFCFYVKSNFILMAKYYCLEILKIYKWI